MDLWAGAGRCDGLAGRGGAEPSTARLAAATYCAAATHCATAGAHGATSGACGAPSLWKCRA